jgi:hypothetical protein
MYVVALEHVLHKTHANANNQDILTIVLLQCALERIQTAMIHAVEMDFVLDLIYVHAMMVSEVQIVTLFNASLIRNQTLESVLDMVNVLLPISVNVNLDTKVSNANCSHALERMNQTHVVIMESVFHTTSVYVTHQMKLDITLDHNVVLVLQIVQVESVRRNIAITLSLVMVMVSVMISCNVSARCGYKSESDRKNGKFSISLGVNPKVKPGDSILLNLLYSLDEVQTSTVTVASPDVVTKPTAIITAPSLVSVCDGITIDGSKSVSTDGRLLVFSWKVDSGNSTNLSNFLEIQTSSIIYIPSNLLTAGSTYNIKLVVTSFFSASSDPVTVTFTKSNSAIAIAKFKGPSYQKVARNSFFRLDAYAELGSCFYSDKTVLYTFKQTTGVPVQSRTEAQALLFNPYTFPAVSGLYEFEVTAIPKANPDVFTSTRVTIEIVLSPLVATISGGSSRSVPSLGFTMDGSKSKDPENSEDSPIFKWTCLDLAYNGNCPQEIQSQVTETSKLEFSGNIPVGRYLFTLVYSKGLRSTTTSVTIDVFHIESNVEIPSVTFSDDLVATNILNPDQSPYIFTAQISGDNIDSVSWYYDGKAISNDNLWSVSYIASSGLTIAKYRTVPTFADHVIQVLAITTSNIHVYSEYSFNMGVPPPVPGSISVPSEVNMLTEVTLVASQWTIADCEQEDRCASQLSYQWVISSGEELLIKTDKLKSNSIVVPGLPSGELTVGVVVYNQDGASTKAEQIVIVKEVDPCETLLLDAIDKLQTMTDFAQSSEANLLSTAISRSQSLCSSRRRSVKSSTQVIEALVTVLNNRFRNIDAATPFSNAFYGEYAGTILNIIQSSTAIGDESIQKLLGLVSAIIDSINKPANSEGIRTDSASILLEALSLIAKLYPAKSSEVMDSSEMLLERLSKNSQYQSTFESFENDLVTFSIGTYLLAELSQEQFIIPQVLSGEYNGTSSFTLPEELISIIEDATSVQIQAQVYAKSLNPQNYQATDQSLLSSLVLSLKIKKLDGTDIEISGLNDTITITVPAKFNMDQQRDPTDSTSSGFYPECRYFNSDEWISDQTCQVTSFTSTSVTFTTNHLTLFAVTYDYKSGIPITSSTHASTPTISNSIQSESSDESSHSSINKMRIGLGIGLGVGLAVVLLILLVIVIVGIAIVVIVLTFKKNKNHNGKQVDDRELHEINVEYEDRV